MVFTELQYYDSSIHIYNAHCYHAQKGNYYFIVASSPISIEVEGIKTIAKFAEANTDYVMYKSTDNSNWTVSGKSVNASSVSIAITSDAFDVQYDIDVQIGEEVIPETTPEATLPPNITVTVGDEVIETLAEIQTVNNEMVEAQHILNGLMSTVLFFFIFVWAEKRIKHAVRSFTGRGLDE